MFFHRNSKPQAFMIMLIMLGSIIILGGCTPGEIPAPPCPEVLCPEPDCPAPIRIEELWITSAHADKDAEAFNHWNEDDPQEIPIECAKCHSRPGFIDFLGVDDSSSGKVDKSTKTGTTITCYVCHNELTDQMTSAAFPSGIIVRGLGSEARCIQCHQGLTSTQAVVAAIEELNITSADSINDDLEFINSHSASASTPFGTEVQGGYEYRGRNYKGRYVRGEEFFTCLRCHNPHTLEVQLETCGECHTYNGLDVKDIRVDTTDFDGDKNIQEGIAAEIEHLHNNLLGAIQDYAQSTIGVSIGFDGDTYPYFFVDVNHNGKIEFEEAVFPNRYSPWSPRLLKAAYNYNYIFHDPGAFAHNSDYIIQLLYDSIEEIGGDTSQYTRP